MAKMRVIVIHSVTLDQVFRAAEHELDKLALLGKCIEKIGEPASPANFVRGVICNDKLPPSVKAWILSNESEVHGMGWWFVPKASSSPLAGQMVRVTKLEGEGEALTATVASIAAREDDPEPYAQVLAKELSGEFPL